MVLDLVQYLEDAMVHWKGNSLVVRMGEPMERYLVLCSVLDRVLDLAISMAEMTALHLVRLMGISSDTWMSLG